MLHILIWMMFGAWPALCSQSSLEQALPGSQEALVHAGDVLPTFSLLLSVGVQRGFRSDAKLGYVRQCRHNPSICDPQ